MPKENTKGTGPARLAARIHLVRIYSNEHGAWWAPYYCGYRTDPARAGIFRYEDAKGRYPEIDYDESKEDYFVDCGLSAKDALADMYTLPRDEFRDKYTGILFSDEAGLRAFEDLVNDAVAAALLERLERLERLAEARPTGE